MTEPILAWHFLHNSGLLRDGRQPPPDGVWLEHEGPIVICESGLHASVRAIDALNYTLGSLVCRVECEGDVQFADDKLVCRRRRILWRADATAALRLFARRQALSVAHLWDIPDAMYQFLETGDEALRDVAYRAVSTLWITARFDSHAARFGAYAARDAVSTARIASHAARYAARDAAHSTVLAASRAAIRVTSWDAAWDAAWTAANTELTDLLLALAPKGEVSNA